MQARSKHNKCLRSQVYRDAEAQTSRGHARIRSTAYRALLYSRGQFLYRDVCFQDSPCDHNESKLKLGVSIVSTLGK